MAHSLQQLFSFLIRLQDDLLTAVDELWLQGAFSTQIQFFTSVLCFLPVLPISALYPHVTSASLHWCSTPGSGSSHCHPNDLTWKGKFPLAAILDFTCTTILGFRHCHPYFTSVWVLLHLELKVKYSFHWSQSPSGSIIPWTLLLPTSLISTQGSWALILSRTHQLLKEASSNFSSTCWA